MDLESGIYFGRVLVEVNSGKKPTCRIETGPFDAEVKDWTQYELPPDGMVYLSEPAGQISIFSVSCYRNHAWMPKVVFIEKIPTFKHTASKHVTYFGTLRVKIKDAEELPSDRGKGPYHTDYKIEDDEKNARRTFQQQNGVDVSVPIQKNLLYGLQ